MYICMHVCMYMYVCMYACICMYIYIYIYIYTYVHMMVGVSKTGFSGCLFVSIRFVFDTIHLPFGFGT